MLGGLSGCSSLSSPPYCVPVSANADGGWGDFRGWEGLGLTVGIS
jgi:hypothetical protein